MALTKEQILGAEDLTRERVDVPEWAPKGTDPKEAYVWIACVSAAELDRYEQSMLFQRQKTPGEPIANVRASLVARTAQDDLGNPIFTAKDIEALGKKSAAPVDRCFDVAQRLNKRSQKDIEELAKNSQSAPSEIS